MTHACVNRDPHPIGGNCGRFRGNVRPAVELDEVCESEVLGRGIVRTRSSAAEL